MSVLRPPGLGPLIGHTTHDSCRLWIQAADVEDRSGELASSRRTVGVFGVVKTGPDGKERVSPAYYFRLPREYDRCGTFVLGFDVELGKFATDGVDLEDHGVPMSLKPDTTYRVRMATLTTDDPAPDAETISDAELAKILPPIENIGPRLLDLTADQCEVTIRTFPHPGPHEGAANGTRQDQLSFLFGSCRYPGLLWKIKDADRIFEHMVKQFDPANADPPPRFTLMVGDQIYADKFNRSVPIGRADTYEEFQDRYRTAFSSPNMRQLLRTAPNYMILDDHEIEDNWTQDRIDKERTLYNFAIGAYMSYQWSHSPRSYGLRPYYRFACGGYPFFVLDTRNERFKDEKAGLADNHMLGMPTIDIAHRSQLDIFLDWLEDQQKAYGNTPKFVTSSSVFCPNDMSERLDAAPGEAAAGLFSANAVRRDGSDSWPAFPSTRLAIINRIVSSGIQNVIFLTGDIHCANTARLTFERDGVDAGLVAYDITSSAFYWPFPFADGNPNNYVHDSKAPNQRDTFPFDGGEMNYRSWGFTQEDNFCRIDIDKGATALKVRLFDRNGDAIEIYDREDKKVVTNVLPLAPWT